jgi:hypothetical protein
MAARREMTATALAAVLLAARRSPRRRARRILIQRVTSRAAIDRFGKINQELRPQRVTIQFETGGAGGGRGDTGGVTGVGHGRLLIARCSCERLDSYRVAPFDPVRGAFLAAGLLLAGPTRDGGGGRGAAAT